MMRIGIELMARGSDFSGSWFCGGGAHQLNADEGEYRNLEAGEEAADAFREHAAVIPQMGE